MKVVLSLSSVQRWLSPPVSKALTQLLGTPTTVQSVNYELFNKITLNDIVICSEANDTILSASKVSAGVDLLEFAQHKISINSIRLFGFDIRLRKDSLNASLNIDPILARFRSDKPTTDSINLAFKSVLLRKGKFSFDVVNQPQTKDKFDPHHIKLENIFSSISVKTLRSDSLHAHMQRLSFEEQSGFQLKELDFVFEGNKKEAVLANFKIALPNSLVAIDTFKVRYDSLNNFDYLAKNALFHSELNAEIALRDLAAFVPAFEHFNDHLKVETHIKGAIDNIQVEHFDVQLGKELEIRAKCELNDIRDKENGYIYGEIDHLKVDMPGVKRIAQNFSKDKINLPEWLDGLGVINFKGEISGFISQLVAYGDLKSDIGTIHTDLLIKQDKKKNQISYSGKVRGKDLELSRLKIKDNPLEKISLDITLDAKQKKGQIPQGVVAAQFSDLVIKGYQYHDFGIDGQFGPNGFDGKLLMNDPNIVFLTRVTYNKENGYTNFKLNSRLDRLNFKALRFYNAEELQDLSLSISSEMQGNAYDKINGYIRIDSIDYRKENQRLFVDSLLVLSESKEQYTKITIDSKYIDGTVDGNISFKTIKNSFLNTLAHYLPALELPQKKIPSNEFNLALNFDNTEELSEIFELPLTVIDKGTIDGYYSESRNDLNVELYFPTLKMNKSYLKFTTLNIGTMEGDKIKIDMSTSMQNKKGNYINLNAHGTSSNNNVDFAFLWGNAIERTFCGKLHFNTTLYDRSQRDNEIQYIVKILPTELILDDIPWAIAPATVTIEKGIIDVDSFAVATKDQYVKIDGKLSTEQSDSLKVDLREVNLENIFAMVNLTHLGFRGIATGNASVCQAFKKPDMKAKLFVEGFGMNNVAIGNLDVNGAWEDSTKAIMLDGRVKGKDISFAKGHIFLGADSMDLRIKANKLSAQFIYPFTKSILSNLDGEVSGNARVYGPLKAITASGDLKVEDGKVGVLFTNTHYTFNDSIYLTPTSVEFRNVKMYDVNGKEGNVNGALYHNAFKDLSFKFDIRTNNMLVYDTKRNKDFPFYGKVNGTGSASIQGDEKNVYIDIDMMNNQSNFIMSLDNGMNANEYGFITFSNQKKHKENVVIDYLQEINHETPVEESQLHLNINMNVTPEGKIQLIMDESTGDFIETTGRGNMQVKYNSTDEAIRMYGKYFINSGMYNYALLGTTDKKFSIRDGSSIAFNGAPTQADLSILASYSLNAFLGDLDDSFLTDNSRSTLVNCLLNINGNLLQPAISFGIELPNAGEDVQRRVLNIISSEDMMNRQMLYLLVFNKFYTPDYANASQKSNELISSASSTISGLLNSALSGIMSENWSLGTNFRTNDLNFTDFDMQIALSSRMLNNRLLFNGSFGYRDNIMSNSSFIGDFDVEYKLTKTGNLRLKAYNKANEKYYLRSGQNTQGLGVVYKRDFSSWRDFFRFKSKKNEQRPN